MVGAGHTSIHPYIHTSYIQDLYIYILDFFLLMSRGGQLQLQSMQRREASVSHLLKLCVPLALALLSMRVALEIRTCGALYRVAPSVRSMRELIGLQR